MQSNQIGNENKTLLFMNKILCLLLLAFALRAHEKHFFEKIFEPPIGDKCGFRSSTLCSRGIGIHCVVWKPYEEKNMKLHTIIFPLIAERVAQEHYKVFSSRRKVFLAVAFNLKFNSFRMKRS